MTQFIHGTAVVLNGVGVLLTGPSGAGKSDLALRLLDRGAQLIADDVVELKAGLMRAPQRLRGKLEVRGIDICNFESVARPIALRLEVALQPREKIERMPEARMGAYGCPVVQLHAFDLSAPLKVELAARRAAEAKIAYSA